MFKLVITREQILSILTIGLLADPLYAIAYPAMESVQQNISSGIEYVVK